MTLQADNHVHSEWSWDAPNGSMMATCARAVELGLPAIAFTEHLDHTVWTTLPGYPFIDALAVDGRLTPPAFDAPGYLEAVDRCRTRFPSLHILTGAEVGEPHRHDTAVRRVLAAGDFDRVLGSLHCLPHGDGYAEPTRLFADRDPTAVMHDYLAEIVEVADSNLFAVLAHIDYPVRYWPGDFTLAPFEDAFRTALRAVAGAEKALEINTSNRLHPTILGWWRDAGGRTVSFGSDAHEPRELAQNFREAARMAEAYGFRPGNHPTDLWWT